MSYQKNNWQSGDVVTSEKLNHLEDGVSNAGGVMAVSLAYDEEMEMTVADKTWQEIYDAMNNDVLCIVRDMEVEENQSNTGLITYVDVTQGEYRIHVLFSNSVGPSSVAVYTTTSADGYPSVLD